MKDRPEIGFDRVLRLPWLDRAVSLLAHGHRANDVRKQLRAAISSEVAGTDAVRKTLSVITGLWVLPPEDLLPLRDQAVRLSQEAGARNDRVLWHWGMALAVYPLFQKVTESAGRLIRLQSTCSASQVQRRMQEQLGERQIVARATRHVLRTLVAWGVLSDTNEKGVYSSATPRRIDDPASFAWLLEAALRAQQSGRARFSTLVRSPTLFPFDLNGMHMDDLARSDCLEALREGSGDEVVRLRGPDQNSTSG